MKIIKDGQLSFWFQGFLGTFGMLMLYYVVTFANENKIAGPFILGLLFIISIALVGLSGYSAQARIWKIKSFGNLTFPKDFKNIHESKTLQTLEKVIDNAFLLVAVSILIIPLIYSNSLKPYLEIYIICVTGFVGFVAMIVLFITVKELVRVLKAKKSSLTPSENIEQ